MVEHTQSLEGETGVGDILVKIRGKHYLIPAEAIGSPLEDGETEVLGMLEKELSTLSAQSQMIGVDFVMELGGSDDRNARAITDDRNARAINARQSRQCVREARQCVREARQCTRESKRQARQCTRSARAVNPQAA
jgi:hypothetical protein